MRNSNAESKIYVANISQRVQFDIRTDSGVSGASLGFQVDVTQARADFDDATFRPTTTESTRQIALTSEEQVLLLNLIAKIEGRINEKPR